MMPELTTLLRGLYKVRRLDEDRVFLLNGKSIRSNSNSLRECLRTSRHRGL